MRGAAWARRVNEASRRSGPEAAAAAAAAEAR
eukprot:CAMPEP_0177550658 /NCGR_PEP_ID=MMETSP0369-20130122/65699_1 /TAXON_ID=447022 ORGANISM="Scrippsiella hangoei-like, Strain SHHI-4" /NCGR_SAMPLE_ID=MMETSP0369 /ASSEMBLY_ACC=CAM_ASM_000364 /LENGTH=31 /DNA_ID= /DNA_START= /DNA_END= /DNA_ORIENTATION=